MDASEAHPDVDVLHSREVALHENDSRCCIHFCVMRCMLLAESPAPLEKNSSNTGMEVPAAEAVQVEQRHDLTDFGRAAHAFESPTVSVLVRPSLSLSLGALTLRAPAPQRISRSLWRTRFSSPATLRLPSRRANRNDSGLERSDGSEG